MNKQIINKRFGTEILPNTAPFSVRATQHVSTHYICDVFGAFESLSDIEETLFVLGIAEEHDNVTLRLNSPGGQHIVGDALIMAMRNCAAPIHIQCSGVAASYATFVLLQADSFEISPFADILCHSASFGYGGKMSETKDAIDFQYRQAEKMIRHYYEGFFTEEEINRIIGGYEHFMTVEEFVERFQARNEYLASLENECECGQCDVDEQQAEAEQQGSSVTQVESSLAPQEDKRSVLPPYAKRSRKKPEAQQGE